MPYGILKKVYDRGMAAYKTGHRPGTTAQQWAFARVNSFVTKSSGTWGKADKDLADKVRASEEVEVQETELGMIPKKKRKGHEVLGARECTRMVRVKYDKSILSTKTWRGLVVETTRSQRSNVRKDWCLL